MNKKSSRIVIIPKGLVDPNNVTIVEIPFEYSRERIVVARYPDEISDIVYADNYEDDINKQCNVDKFIDNNMSTFNRENCKLQNCKSTSTNRIANEQNIISDNYQLPSDNKCKSVSFYYQKKKQLSKTNIPEKCYNYNNTNNYGSVQKQPQRLNVTTIQINRSSPTPSNINNNNYQSPYLQNFDLNKSFVIPSNVSHYERPSPVSSTCKIDDDEFMKTISYIEEEEQKKFLAELEKLQTTRRELLLKNDTNINNMSFTPSNRLKFKCRECNFN